MPGAMHSPGAGGPVARRAPLVGPAVPGEVPPLATLVAAQGRVEGPAPCPLRSGTGHRHSNATTVYRSVLKTNRQDTL